jgi:hypothetical protein
VPYRKRWPVVSMPRGASASSGRSTVRPGLLAPFDPPSTVPTPAMGEARASRGVAGLCTTGRAKGAPCLVEVARGTHAGRRPWWRPFDATMATLERMPSCSSERDAGQIASAFAVGSRGSRDRDLMTVRCPTPSAGLLELGDRTVVRRPPSLAYQAGTREAVPRGGAGRPLRKT